MTDMMTAPLRVPEKVTRRAAFVPPRKITESRAFPSVRLEKINKADVRTLTGTLMATGSLDPILLWQEQDDEGITTGRLILLDGRHRLAAYASGPLDGRWKTRGVPAVVLSCSFGAARRAAFADNVKHSRPLTAPERLDAAWSLVCDGEHVHSKPQIAKATAVSQRTILTMRNRRKQMIEAGTEFTGIWWRDREDRKSDEEEDTMMTDKEREAEKARLVEALRKAAGNTHKRDSTLFFEALDEAFGRNLKDAAEYLYAENDEFFREVITTDMAVDDEDLDG
jgi:hypothetical protein